MNESKTNRFQYRGKVLEVLPEKTFASGFKLREFVCRVERGQYFDCAVFTAKGPVADKVAALNPGDLVDVDFVLDGRCSTKSSPPRWFGSAAALKVEVASGANAGCMASPNGEVAPEPEAANPDLPF